MDKNLFTHEFSMSADGWERVSARIGQNEQQDLAEIQFLKRASTVLATLLFFLPMAKFWRNDRQEVQQFTITVAQVQEPTHRLVEVATSQKQVHFYWLLAQSGVHRSDEPRP